jgi:hypothetical protein
LFAKTELDLLSAFREGKDIISLITKSLGDKHWMLGGNDNSDWGKSETQSTRRSMMGIGG